MPSKRPSPLPDVINYDDYRHYIRDWQGARKLRGEQWSCEFIGRKVTYRRADGSIKGVHRSHVQNIVQGARDLAPEFVDGFVRVFGLTPDRASFFGNLVTYTQARSGSERQRAYLSMLANRQYLTLRPIDAKRHEVLSSLKNLALFEMAGHPSFEEDPATLAGQLLPNSSTHEVRWALQMLEDAGYLRRRKGILTKDVMGIEADNHAQAMAIARLHCEAIELARGALDHFEPGERDFQLMVELIPVWLLERVKIETHEFLSRIQALCSPDSQIEVPTGADTSVRAYLIAMQMFPLSTPI